MDPSQATARLVRQRARERCEYCRLHQSLQVSSFHIEHVIPTSVGGPSTGDNLALACPGCNLHKTNRLAAADPLTNDSVPLFNPRLQIWAEHFGWLGFEIQGLTATGRATVDALLLNHPRRIKARMAEEMFDLFPPESLDHPDAG